MGSYKDSSEAVQKQGTKMPLETATYIHDLVASNPAATDGLSQGDDHLRLIKSVLQANFPNFTSAALNSSNAALDAAVNVLTGTSGTAAFPAGTAGAPSITFSGDPTTGWYQPAVGQWDFGVSGSPLINIASTGMAILGGFAAQAVTSTGAISATGAYSGGTGQLCPPGAVMMWLTNTAPTGWAFLNASVVSAASNPVLASIFGSVGGNVTLPDWRGYVPIGVGTMGGTTHGGPVNLSGIDGLNGAVGSATHTLTTSECPTGLITFNDASHSHTYTVQGGMSAIWTTGASGGGNTTLGAGTTSIIGGSIVINSSTTGCSVTDHAGNGAHTIVQPSATCAFIIKLG